MPKPPGMTDEQWRQDCLERHNRTVTPRQQLARYILDCPFETRRPQIDDYRAKHGDVAADDLIRLIRIEYFKRKEAP